MNGSAFILRRIAYGAALLLVVVVFNFALLKLAPGDPAVTIAGEMGGATEEILQEIRANYGLDKPVIEQLGIYLKNVLTGNFGKSYYYDQPVIKIISAKIFPTLLLASTAWIIALSVGVFLGVIASLKPQGWFSVFVTSVATIGYALPVFWVGIVLIIVFGSIFPIFPVEGMISSRFSGGAFAKVIDIAHHIFLPALSLSIFFLAQYARLTRATMIEVLEQDYIRTARAMGLSSNRVIWHYALRNALLPIVTVAGLQFGNLISGALLVETVFNWPGMGRLVFDSILRRDYPTVLGIVIISTIMVIIVNIITDILYRVIDPRIRIDVN